MAHFAELDQQNIVQRVVVVNNLELLDNDGNENEQVGINFCKNIFGSNTNWKQTSYNGVFRKNYAGIGFEYDLNRDAFIASKPYPSWVLDNDTCIWKAPIDYPTTGLNYFWDEPTTSWKRNYAEFLRTPKKVIDKVMEYVNPSDKFYDLGSGDGCVLNEVIKITTNVKGFEILPNLIDESKKLVGDCIIEADIIDVNLNEATVIYMYLDQQTNDFMKEKIKTLPSKTKIISYSFNFKNWEPTYTHIIDDISLYVWVV